MTGNVFVVLGMHKSGTTLVSDILHRSGVPMVEVRSSEGYDQGNKMERDATRLLNIDLLGEGPEESLRLIRPLDRRSVTAEHEERARSLCEEASDAASGSDWGFKDPRTLLTYEFWRGRIGNPRLIGIFRDPVEVFQHYLRRAGRRWISRDPTYLPDALLAWCVYNQKLLALKKSEPEMILLDYTDLLSSDASFGRLETFVGRNLADCRKRDMRRATSDRTLDYRLARQVVRLRNRVDPDWIHSELRDAVEPSASSL